MSYCRIVVKRFFVKNFPRDYLKCERLSDEKVVSLTKKEHGSVVNFL